MAISQRNIDLFNRLNAVQTVGQALEIADIAIGAGSDARDLFGRFSLDPSRRQSRANISDAVDDVIRERKNFAGAGLSPGMPVGRSWDDLRKAIGRLYGAMWAALDTQGTDDEWTALKGQLEFGVTESIRRFPEGVQAVVSFATDTAGKAAGNVLAPVAGPLSQVLWPVALLVIVAVVGATVLISTGKVKVPL